MKMTLVEMIDEILIRAGNPMTVYELTGAIREMFSRRVDLRSLVEALEGEPSFVRTGWRAYGLDRAARADRLAASFGFVCA
jgi:hypothetical protein